MEKKVLATVNGREITEESLNFAISKFPPERRNFFMSEEGKRQFLDQIISWELMYDYALDKKFENREDYKFQLQEAGKAILTQMAIEDVINKTVVTEEEIREYYAANSGAFGGEEKVHARHILVDSKEKALEVKELIKNGLSFEEAAQMYSSCPSKQQGGDLGEFGRGMMVPEFEEAAFSAEEGVLSDPVKTQFGYHLILVEDKIEGAAKSFDEVKDAIRTHLLQEKQGNAYLKEVDNLKKIYPVEIK